MATYQTYAPGSYAKSDQQKKREQQNDYWGNQQLKEYHHDAYIDPESVKQWKQKLDALQKPGSYAYGRQDVLDSLYEQINNRKPFSYDLNGDMLYQQYKDQYLTQGKLAMKDTMGQAATMTGGYGNSYAQSVGQQAYQGYLQQLNDKIPQLYQLAYDKYKDEGADLQDRLGLLENERARDYSQYRDTVSDYNNERGYYTDRLDADRTYAMNKWNMDDERIRGEVDSHNDNIISNRNYWSNEVANGYEREYGAWADNEKLRQAAISSANDKISREYDDALSLLKSGSTGAGTGSGEDFQRYTYASEDPDAPGNNVYYRDGKKYSFAQGVNPYTGTKNADAKYGTFGNGYQPNNVGGKQLTKTGITDVVNGVTQQVWQTPDGTMYIWDGTKNAYQLYGEQKSVKATANKKAGGKAHGKNESYELR